MAISALVTLSEALKEYYLEPLKLQISDKMDPLFTLIEKSSRGIEGSKVKFPLRYGSSGGVGMRDELGALPEANPRQIKSAEVETKNFYGVISLSQKLIDSTQSNRSAFVNQLETQMKDLTIDMKKNFNRQLYGDGRGIIATVENAVSAGATIPVSTTAGLLEGMYVDLFDPTGVTKKSSKNEIISVDRGSNTITLETSVTLAKGDIIVNYGSYGKEITGLSAIFKRNALIYGIDRSKSQWFNPIQIANASPVELSESMIQRGIDEADDVDTDINFILTSKGVRRAYFDLLSAQKRSVNTLELKGGFKALDYNGVPLTSSKFAPNGTIRMINTDDIFFAQLKELDWMDKDGSVLHRNDNVAAYSATMYQFAELCCSKSSGLVEITGIKEH